MCELNVRLILLFRVAFCCDIRSRCASQTPAAGCLGQWRGLDGSRPRPDQSRREQRRRS